MVVVGVTAVSITDALPGATPALAVNSIELASVGPLGQSPDGYSFLQDVTASGDVLFTSHSRSFQDNPLSANFSRLYLGSGSTSTAITPSAGFSVERAGVSDNGRWVAYVLAPGILLYDSVDQTTTHVVTVGEYNQFVQTSRIDVSDDGRYIVFDTVTALDTADTNGVTDVYRFDRQDSSLDWVSINSDGTVPDGASAFPRMVPGGREVVFTSEATNLIGGDTNGARDAFVWTEPYGFDPFDPPAAYGSVYRVSTDGAGGQLGAASGIMADISDDGRYVVFDSADTAVSPAPWSSVIRKDRYTNAVEVASRGYREYDAQSRNATISADGWTVAFESDWTRATTGQFGNWSDVVVKDFASGLLELASVSLIGSEANGQASNPVVAPNGGSVAFDSFATDLILSTPVLETGGTGVSVYRTNRAPDPLPVTSYEGPSGQTDFANATAAETTDIIDFDGDGLSDGQDLSSAYTAQGVTMTGLSARYTTTFTHSPPFGAQASGYNTPLFTGDFTIELAEPASSVSFWANDIEAEIVVRAVLSPDGGVDSQGAPTVQTVSFPVSRPLANGSRFYGFTADKSEITRIIVESPGDLFIIDDLHIGRKVDTTGPTILITSPADGATYTQGDVVIARWTCEDDTDPSPTCVPPSFTWYGLSIDTSIVGPKTFTVTSTDRHANASSVTHSYTIAPDNVPAPDTSAPTITVNLPIDGGQYTIGDAVFASYLCDDGAGSGVATCEGTAGNGTAIDTSTVGIHTFVVDATDVAGNTAASTSVTYEIVAAGDVTAPQIWINRPADGESFSRYQANVVVNFSCADTDSGIASCTGTSPAGSVIDTTTPGTYPFTVTAVDVAGTSSTLSANYTVLGGTTDTAPPWISVMTPVHLARYATGSTHTVSFACTDSTPPSSGVASCLASASNGSLLDTSLPGVYGISFSSVDRAGNIGTNYRQYQVVDDRDGDGLSDLWETQGIDVDNDGVVDLPLHQAPYNADPDHRDVFVEMDYMTCTLSPGGCAVGDRTSQAPQPGAVDDVVAAFAAAPLSNPDGTTGIRLHVDVDEAVPEIKNLPFIQIVAGPDNDFEDIRSGAAGACNGRFGTQAERADPACPKLIRSKALVYRYGLWAHSYANSFGSSGIAEMPGNDFLVTTGGEAASWASAAGSLRAAESGTLMHELGHTLGLGHGGKGDNRNCKSNYLSVMNYALQVPNYDPTRPLDYSQSVLPTLFEGALVESAGVGGPSGRNTVYALPNGSPRVVPTDGPIDWNNDGDTADTVARNINDFCTFFASPGNEILPGADDWANLVYSFTAYPDFAPGSRFSTEELVDQEIRAVDAEQAAQTLDFDDDGVANSDDVCPAIADPTQSDVDGDDVGDACDDDSLAPTAAPSAAPPPNTAGWNNTNVTVSWNWSDENGGSGIDPEFCTTSSVSSGEGAGIVLTASCSDLAGHAATASTPVNVDRTAPVIVCPASPKRGLNASGSTLTAAVADVGGSGVASPSVTVAAPTDVAGARSVTVAATDLAGNTASATCGYQVTYTVQWLLPVGGTTSPRSVLRNTVVPFTFRLVDANGAAVNSAVVSVPTSTLTACPSGANPPLVVSVPGNPSTLKLGNGWWLAGWKPATAWRATCRFVSIGLTDGTTITATYKVI